MLIVLALVSCTSREEITIADGTLEAVEVIVSAEGNGRILSFDAEEGREVRRGEVIGSIDDRQLVLQKQQLAAARRRVESQRPDIETQTAPLQEQLAAAERELTRVSRLAAADAASARQLDEITSRVTTLERQLAAQRQSLEQSLESLGAESESLSYQIDLLDDRIQRCSIVSPIDGTLITSYTEAGELAVTGKPLFKVADMTGVFLRAYITSGQLTKLKLGDTVKVKVDSGEDGNRLYDGKLSWISEKAEFTPKTIQTRDERASLVYAVKVSLVNDGFLKLGMYGAIIEAR